MAAEAGATVIAVSRSSQNLDQHVAPLARRGLAVVPVAADASTDDGIATVMDAFRRADGDFDGLVNVAGGAAPETWMPATRVTRSDWRELFTTNLETALISVATVVGNKPIWDAGLEVRRVNNFRKEAGFAPCQPKNVMFMCCTPDEPDAAQADEWIWTANRDLTKHYGLADASNFKGVKGYEAYAAREATATAVLAEAVQKEKPEFGTMPYADAIKSVKLFAREVLPAVHDMAAPLHPGALPAEVHA